MVKGSDEARALPLLSCRVRRFWNAEKGPSKRKGVDGGKAETEYDGVVENGGVEMEGAQLAFKCEEPRFCRHHWAGGGM